jgi:hypothetical protein
MPDELSNCATRPSHLRDLSAAMVGSSAVTRAALLD